MLSNCSLSPLIKDYLSYTNAISLELFNNKNLLETKTILKEVCELKNGYAFKSSTYNINGVFKVLTIANVQGYRFVTTKECNRISSVPHDLQEFQKLKENDILVSMTGNVGRVSLCKRGYSIT